MSLGLDGSQKEIAEVPGMPSGLGWLPDGTLIVVSVMDGKLMAVRDGGLEEVADMRAVTGNICNDMVVDAGGRAYIGSLAAGWDESKVPNPGNMQRFGYVVLVRQDGDRFESRIVADRVTCPNGACITPDGKTLIFAESIGFRLTAFDIDADGSLVNRRPWADLGAPPDGICMDEEGCLWVALCYFEYGGPGGIRAGPGRGRDRRPHRRRGVQRLRLYARRPGDENAVPVRVEGVGTGAFSGRRTHPRRRRRRPWLRFSLSRFMTAADRPPGI